MKRYLIYIERYSNTKINSNIKNKIKLSAARAEA